MRNKEELDLLGKIFASSLENFHGVDSVRFRAQHHESRACLDSLESSGYIERTNNKLLLTFENIFTTLRNSYIEGRAAPGAGGGGAGRGPGPRGGGGGAGT